MAKIPREVVEEIRDRADIVAVVSRRVQLKRTGNAWVGLCPFHQEKTPSFNVIPSKAMFYCHGCKKGGDVFRFLMEVEGLAFVEAIKELAGQVGVQIPERELTPEERRQIRRRAGLYEVMQVANEYFESRLWTTSEGEVGRKYLVSRGYSEELSRKASLGWAPEGWTRLADHLQSQGFPAPLVLAAGLARERDRGGLYDAFRERLIIPIRDERSRVIAFGGRTLSTDKTVAKYINSTETPLYHKSKVLYGLDMARRAIEKEGVVLVEGYFDVLAMHKAGFEQAVATCGTALTHEHVQRLQRITSRVYVLTDADEAGEIAAEKALPLFLEAKLSSFRVELDGAKDPDELVASRGPEALAQALKRAEPLFDWYTRRTLTKHGYSADGKQRTLEQITAVIGGSRITDAQIARISGLLRLDERGVRRHLIAHTKRSGPAASASRVPRRRLTWRPHVDVVHLLWLVVHRYDQVADIIVRADPRFLAEHRPVRPSLARLLSGEPVASVIDEERHEDVRRTLTAVVARARLYSEDEAAGAACSVLARLASPIYEARVAAVQREAISASRRGESEAARERMQALAVLRDLRLGLKRLAARGSSDDELDAASQLLAPNDLLGSLEELLAEPEVAYDESIAPTGEAHNPPSPPDAAPGPPMEEPPARDQPPPLDDADLSYLESEPE